VAKKIKKFNWGSVIYIIVLILFGWLIYSKWDEILIIMGSWHKVGLKLMLLALIFEILVYFMQAKAFQYIYNLFGLRVKWERMYWLLLKSFFMGVVAPTGGFLIGAGVMVDDGQKMGFSKIKLLLANVVYWVMFFTVFIFFLLISLFFLIIKNQIQDYILIPAIIMLVLAIVMLTIMVVMLNDYQRFKKYSLWVGLIINQINQKMGRGILLSEKKIKQYSYELFEGYNFVISNVFKLKKILLMIVLMIVCNVLLLSTLVASVDGDFGNIGVLMATYIIAAMLMMVSVTPSGLGVVELAMTSILSAFVLPVEGAVLVVVMFRLFQFWLPLVSGFWVFRKS
jgi:phosphatidylglycerol lysyltransferase